MDQTFIELLLDRSGSMASCRDATLGAANEYITGSQADPALNGASFALTIFDSASIETIRDGIMSEIAPLTAADFVPRGSTPLLDAIGRSIASLDAKLAKAGAKRAVLVVATDGQENASRKHTFDSISLLIKARQEEGWLVIFLGAGLEAAKQGAKLGVDAGKVAAFSTDLHSFAFTLSSSRRYSSDYAGAATPAAAAILAKASGFSDEERRSMGDETAGAGLAEPASGPAAPASSHGAPAAGVAPDDAWGAKSAKPEKDVWSK